MRAGLPVVDWFCGDKPFPPTSEPLSAWDHELKHLSVLVFEANTFLNLLRRDASGHPRARMADVDLLVSVRRTSQMLDGLLKEVTFSKIDEN
eukprot:1161727-Pelagomonas_calceolata.AAC.20